MTRELDKCAMERDRYRLILQQVRSDTRALSLPNAGAGLPGRPVTGGELLAATRDHNNQLKLELETLRARYEECARDAVALRRQLHASPTFATDVDSKVEGRDSNLVQRLETLNNKYAQLRRDLSATLDEKEELTTDRDYYKSQLERFTRHLAATTSTPDTMCRLHAGVDLSDANEALDLEHLQAENRSVRERLAQTRAENQIMRQTLAKYRNLLKSRTKKAGVYLNDSMDIATQQQVRKLVDRCAGGENEIRTLCLSLLDILSDKFIALQHQRKSNRVLATRVADLEKTLESWAEGGAILPPFPSQLLLDEFRPDTTVTSPSSGSHGADSDQSAHSEDSDDSEATSSGRCRLGEQQLEAERNGDMSDGRVVLPPELEELVCEALRQMQSAYT